MLQRSNQRRADAAKYLERWMVLGDSEVNTHSIDPRGFGGYANSEYTRSKSFNDYENMFETPLTARRAWSSSWIDEGRGVAGRQDADFFAVAQDETPCSVQQAVPSG